MKKSIILSLFCALTITSNRVLAITSDEVNSFEQRACDYLQSFTPKFQSSIDKDIETSLCEHKASESKQALAAVVNGLYEMSGNSTNINSEAGIPLLKFAHEGRMILLDMVNETLSKSDSQY